MHVLLERLQLGNRAHSVMLGSSCFVMRTGLDLRWWWALPITKWPLEESKVDMLLWKIRKPKTWWNPDLITQYDAERLKTVVWLDSTRLLTSLDHSGFILAWDWRILFKLHCERYVQGKIYHGWSWQGSCASLVFIKLFIMKYSCLKISVS